MSRWLVLFTFFAMGASLAQEAPKTPSSSPADVKTLLPTPGVIHVLVDDVTGDGQSDLVFTSHNNNQILLYRNNTLRRFETAKPYDIAGFHPNDTILLPGNPKRYLINAEGEGALKVVKAESEGGLSLVSERAQPAPRSSTPFFWPGWNLSLAIAPYFGKTLTLLRGFNPENGEVQEVYSLAVGNEPKQVRLADLNADGIEELVLAARLTNEVWVIDYPGADKAPVPRRLWSFEKGWPRHVLPFDIDRNGTMDLLVPMAVEQEIAVLLNDGKGVFSEGKPIPYPGRSGIHMMTAGQDQDGTRYLLAGGVYTLVLYREAKDKPATFETVQLPLASWPNWLELKDIDGDGWLDAVAAMQSAVPSFIIYGPLWDNFSKLTADKSAQP